MMSARRSEEEEDHGDAGSTEENSKRINILMGINWSSETNLLCK
jgi:hypothetical protein